MSLATVISLPFWMLLMLFQLYRAQRARDRKDGKWRTRIAEHRAALARIEAALARETGRRSPS